MKAGDKLLCKKDLFDDLIDAIFLMEGHKYEISDIQKLQNVRVVSIIKKHGYVASNYFSVDIDFEELDEIYYLWDYFYKPEEIRKMKLESL
jgi:hypothetical protein